MDQLQILNENIISVLKERFLQYPQRHPIIKWEAVEPLLRKYPEKLKAIMQMEQTGGEPDLLGFSPEKDAFLFVDFSKESPTERRSLCYDEAALESRKQNKPRGSALGAAMGMGVELMTISTYHLLQEKEQVDTKTSSWLATPADIRALGGAVFGDNRYNTVFIYHNGAESYYAARGFRSELYLPVK